MIFYKRIKIYLSERFPVLLYFPFVAILYLAMSFITQIISNKTPYINLNSIIGILSVFFMMLLIRTFDDIKDNELDYKIFPNRPVPRGDVLISDVKILSVISFIILILLNVFFAVKTLWLFYIMITYTLLTFKWFFAKQLHLNNPKIAMVTHQPLPLVILFFALHTALASSKIYYPFTINHFFVLLLFSLPITAWEISRKIKSPDNENKYETFSKIFGVQIATLIPVILYSIASFFALIIGYKLDFSIFFFILIGTDLIFLMYFFIRFYINPISKNNILQQIAVIFTSLLFVIIIAFLVLNYSIKIG